MGLFDSFRKTQKNDILNIIVPLAEEGVRNIESDFKPTTKEGKFEIFMFNIFLGWMYFLERDKIDTSSDIGNQKLLKLFEYSLKQNIKWEISDLVVVYKERFRSYKEDLSGIQKSNYPKTKQYLPAYTFNSMYYEPLKKYQDLSWTDFNNMDKFDVEKCEELSEFTGALISQINRIFKELMN